MRKLEASWKVSLLLQDAFFLPPSPVDWHRPGVRNIIFLRVVESSPKQLKQVGNGVKLVQKSIYNVLAIHKISEEKGQKRWDGFF